MDNVCLNLCESVGSQSKTKRTGASVQTNLIDVKKKLLKYSCAWVNKSHHQKYISGFYLMEPSMQYEN